jgi:Retrotransposon gag protein
MSGGMSVAGPSSGQDLDLVLRTMTVSYPKASLYDADHDIDMTQYSPVEAQMPHWFSMLYLHLEDRIAGIERLQQEALAKNQDLNVTWPELKEAYRTLVAQQREIYHKAAEDVNALADAAKHEFAGIRNAVDIFYEEAKMAFYIMESKNDREKKTMKAALVSLHDSNMASWQALHEGTKYWEKELKETTEMAVRAMDKSDALQVMLDQEKHERNLTLLAAEANYKADIDNLRDEFLKTMKSYDKRLKGHVPESLRSSLKEHSKKKAQKIGSSSRGRKKSVSFTTVTDPASGKQVVIDLRELERAQREARKKAKGKGPAGKSPTPPGQRIPTPDPNANTGNANTGTGAASGAPTGTPSGATGTGGTGGKPPRRRRRHRTRSSSSGSSSPTSSSSSSSSSSDSDSSLSSIAGRWRRGQRVTQSPVPKGFGKKKKSKGKVTMDRPKRPNPKQFGGNPNEDFRVWLRTVESFVDYVQDSWSSDREKISWVSSLLKDKAEIWYQQRVITMAANNFNDTWTSFVSAMEQKYLNTHEVAEKHREMFELKYEGDVRDYIHRMQNLNSIVNVGDLTYIEALRKNLPFDIKQGMTFRGPDPEEVTPYENKLEEVGRLLENLKKENKKNHPQQPEGEKKGGKRKRERGNKGSNDADEPKPKKQDVGDKKNTWVKGTPPKYTADKRAERTAGLQQTQIDSRTKGNLCITCGEAGHRWQWCPNAIRTSSLRKVSSVKKGKGKKEKSKSEDSAPPATTTPAVSSVKREPPKHTVGPGLLDRSTPERILADLWQRGGATTPFASSLVSAQAGTSTSEKSLKERIWEVDSENEVL